MPIRYEDLTLGEARVFRVTQLPAMRAVKLAARIGRILGPALGAAAANGLDAKVDFEQAARVLFDRLEPDELEKLLKELLATTTRGDGSGRTVPVMDVFDVEFAGDGLKDLIELVKFALNVQFSSFGPALQAAGSAFLPTPAAKIEAPVSIPMKKAMKT